MRGKGTKLGKGKGNKLGEGCPKVRLSQDRMPILPPRLAQSRLGQARLGQARRDGGISVNVWDFYDFRYCYVRGCYVWDNYVVPRLDTIGVNFNFSDILFWLPFWRCLQQAVIVTMQSTPLEKLQKMVQKEFLLVCSIT